MFFLCALRLNHEAIHGNLGLPAWGHRAVLHALSVLMLGSNHAVAFSHLQHHRTPLGDADHEGACGRMGLWQVLCYGPLFPWHLNAAAWHHGGPRWQRRLLLDGALIAAWLGLVAVLGWLFLWWHVAMTALGQCCTAFFAVWITHHDLDEHVVARSQRGPLAILAYEMFYHREHHLFPKVPVRNLPRLARRLDAQVPGYAAFHYPIVGLLEPRGRGAAAPGAAP
jgi:fatty acid desaturase